MFKRQIQFNAIWFLFCMVVANGMPADAEETSPSEAADAIMAVNEQLGAKNYADALTLVDAFIKKHPDFTQFYLQKGYVQFRLKQYDDALSSLNHCLTAGYVGVGPKAIESLNAEVWLDIGHCKLAKEDNDGARQAFKKAFELYPDLEDGFELLRKMSAGSPLSIEAGDKLKLVTIAKETLKN